MDDEPKTEMSEEERRELKKLALQGQFAETKLMGVIVICIVVFCLFSYVQFKALDRSIGWETVKDLPIGRALGRWLILVFCMPPMLVTAFVFRLLKPRGSSWG